MTPTKRTLAERRASVMEQLSDPLTAGNSDAVIARFCGVTPGFVKKLKAQSEAKGTAFQKGSYHQLPIASLRRDGGTQPRATTDDAICREYRDSIKAGATFPPIGVVHDGQDYWVWDGYHRTRAHEMAGRMTINCEVRQGTRRDAVLLAAGANAGHGLRRTNEEKRRAVECLLRDREWVTWSNEEIARRCGVSNQTVSNIRKDLESNGEVSSQILRAGADGKTYAVTNIGTRPATNGHTSAAPVPANDSAPPMSAPEVVDHRIKVTLNGDDEADSEKLLASGYPREKLRRLAARLLEHFDEEDETEAAPFRPSESHLKLLDRLRRGPAPLDELEEIGGNRYAARFWELRRAGYDIARINGNAYELVGEPKE